MTNRADEARSVTLQGTMTDLLTGQKVKEQVTLEPKMIMILRE